MNKVFDATAFLGYAGQQAAIINAQMYSIEYPEMDLAGLIPVNTNIPEWASIAYTGVMDHTGRAAWQSTFSKDVPLADVSVEYLAQGFAEYAVGYQWNIGELGQAQNSGFPLTTRRAEAARFAADLFVYETALIGDTVKGWGGLINHPQAFMVPAAANGTGAPTTAWVLNDGTGNKTPEEIVADVNAVLMGPQNGSLGVIANQLADTLLLPPMAFGYIAVTPFGVTSPGKSILQVIQETNVYTTRTGRPLTIRELPALSTAATVGVAGGGRAVAYRNDASVLELPMPMVWRLFPVYQDGPFNFTTPGLGRIGALDLKRPALRYLDGITPVPPALADLTLADTATPAATPWTSTITGETAGSIISATASDGTVVTVTGTNAGLSATFPSAGTVTITMVEQLGLWGSKTSSVDVVVS